MKKNIEFENAIINENNEIYINEKILGYIVNFYVNDKGLSVTNNPISTTSIKIEELLFNNELVPIEKESLLTLSEKIVNFNIKFNIYSSGPLKENISNELILKTISESFTDENILYTGQTDNKYIVILNNITSENVLKEILPSFYEEELYTNVRILIELNENGEISTINGDTYYIFDNRDIYYYFTTNIQ